MPQIHPTAAVNPQACLADDVFIGPHCVILGPAVLGPGTRLIAHVHLQGPITLGQSNTLYPYVCLGFEPQDRKFPPGSPTAGVRAGDHNIFREYTTIHAATGDKPTTIGHHNYFMVNSHLGHDVQLGDHNTLANGSLVGGHVHIHDHVTLGGNAAVQQFCRVGRLAMLSGVMGITRDLPPFCTVYNTRQVASLNVVGLRRAGYQRDIPALKKAFDILYRSNHTVANAVQRIRDEMAHQPLCLELAEFVDASKIGICNYGTPAQAPIR